MNTSAVPQQHAAARASLDAALADSLVLSCWPDEEEALAYMDAAFLQKVRRPARAS